MTSSDLKLSNATLGQLPPEVAVPKYNRADLKPGIVHFGIGPFSRAHVVMLADDLANQGHMDCGVVGISFSKPDVRDALAPQDFLYSVQEKTPEAKTRVVGNLLNVLVAPENPVAVIDQMAHPDTHLVTLTITQKGYHYSKEKGFDIDNPAIQDSLQHRDAPKAAVGFIVAALERRMNEGLPPFTVMSCDNINNNSSVLRHTVMAYALKVSPKLAEWIDTNVSFPNTMVDRITPSYKPEDTAQIKATHGYDDAQPAMTEKPWQLYVETKPGLKLPPFDKVGATYVEDVAPYELAKIRLLNGMHMALGIIGRQQGFTLADEALANPSTRTFMQGYMDEVKATLEPLPDLDYDDYIESLFVRVSNPLMSDPLQRLARGGIDKIETRFIGPLEDAYAKDLPRAHLVAAVAGWITYMQAADPTDDKKGKFYIEDTKAYKEGVVSTAQHLGDSVAPLLANEKLWGKLRQIPEFEQELQAAYEDRTGRSPASQPAFAQAPGTLSLAFGK